MFNIPLEIGDVVLGGRFKNKKITVKELGFDEYGNPTVNGRSILKIRIPKLYQQKDNMKKKIQESVKATIKKENGRWKVFDGERCVTPDGFETKEQAQGSAALKGYDFEGSDEFEYTETPKPTKHEPVKYKKPETMELSKEKEIKLEQLLRKKILRELKLMELDVTGTDLEEDAKKYLQMANEMKILEAKLAEMQKEYKVLDNKFRDMVETVGKTKDTFIRAGKFLIKIEREGYEKNNPKYKVGFDWLKQRVNGKMKELVDEAMKLSESKSQIASAISVVVDDGSVNENRFTDMLKRIGNWFSTKISKLLQKNTDANKALDKLEQYFR
jgi:hypothetical protein